MTTDQRTLHFTPSELAHYEKLPAALREGWIVKEETGTAYETEEVLEIRRAMLRFQKNPSLQPLLEKLKQNIPLEQLTSKDLPEEILPDLFFGMGARGVTVLIELAFGNVKDEEDVAGLAGLTKIRHDLLEANAKASAR
jgi:hypothetical protein